MVIRDNDHDINESVWFFLMGGMEGFFILWHAGTLSLALCGRNTVCNRAMYWLLRIFHMGAILLMVLMIYEGLAVWPALPDVFAWTLPMAFLFFSMITKYITLIYWAAELVVDLLQSN